MFHTTNSSLSRAYDCSRLPHVSGYVNTNKNCPGCSDSAYAWHQLMPLTYTAVAQTLKAFRMHAQIDEHLQPDALHPNAQGMELVAQCLAPFVWHYMKE